MRQSVNLSTCSPTTAWPIMFPPKLTTYAAYSTSLHPATICGHRPSMLSTSACLHRLLRWPVSKRRPTPVCSTTVVRPRCQLDAASFRATVCRRRYCANRRPGTSVRLGRFIRLCCGAERVKSPSERSGAASGGGSKKQVHERERSGSRAGGRRNEAVSESPVNEGESRAGNFAAPFRSHALHTNILGSVQICSQQNKWEIHLKVHCVSLLDIQRLTTD